MSGVSTSSTCMRSRFLWGRFAVILGALACLSIVPASAQNEATITPRFVPSRVQELDKDPSESVIRSDATRTQLSEIEQFAWMAERVYCMPDELATELDQSNQAEAKQKQRCRSANNTWAHRFEKDWILLDVAPNQFFQRDDERQSHLFYAAFARKSSTVNQVDIAVVFRGTVFNSGADWWTNLRWVTRIVPGPDHYRLLARDAKSIWNAAQRSAGEKLGLGVDKAAPIRYRLITTGHSLGGGLAQLMAYSTPPWSTNTRVATVVFDPSVVTGYESLVSNENVNCDVPIWRVEEVGEALTAIRRIAKVFYPWSQNIRRFEVDDFEPGSAASKHSMSLLANNISEAVTVPLTYDAVAAREL